MLVGIGGGQFSSGETKKIDEYVLGCLNKKNCKLLLLPTAAYDDTGYIRRVKRYFKKMNVVVDVINYAKNTYDSDDLVKMFDEADIIYLSGGNTLHALETWKQKGIDLLIKDAYIKNKCIMGISAGTISMCAKGYSEISEDNYQLINGLDLIDIAVCPHYNLEARKTFDSVTYDNVGIALEDNTAFIYMNEVLSIIKSDDSAKAYIVKNGKKEEFINSIKLGG
ncbi:MAG: Type 1 glutamine amidotransferase-like domain-containing protein [Erysipelotrichales bacterium]|nr:Type 1 glutamine amidotransferase-like domain-containing protein [Erysipelotrichales bacterium]